VDVCFVGACLNAYLQYMALVLQWTGEEGERGGGGLVDRSRRFCCISALHRTDGRTNERTGDGRT
jgi:hypothetical protein